MSHYVSLSCSIVGCFLLAALNTGCMPRNEKLDSIASVCPSKTQDSDVLRLLTSGEIDTFQLGYKTAFSSGYSIVPHLLHWSLDDAPVNFYPPIHTGAANVPSEGARVRTVALYLLEAIRTGRLVHSMSPYIVPSEGETDEAAECRAIGEYVRWWASVRRFEFPAYVPSVLWMTVSEEMLEHRVDADGSTASANVAISEDSSADVGRRNRAGEVGGTTGTGDNGDILLSCGGQRGHSAFLRGQRGHSAFLRNSATDEDHGRRGRRPLPALRGPGAAASGSDPLRASANSAVNFAKIRPIPPNPRPCGPQTRNPCPRANAV